MSAFFDECLLVHMIMESMSDPAALDWWIRFSSSPVSADGRLCPCLISLWSLIISPSVVLRSGGSHRQHHVAFGCTHYNIHSITHSHYPSCKKSIPNGLSVATDAAFHVPDLLWWYFRGRDLKVIRGALLGIQKLIEWKIWIMQRLIFTVCLPWCSQ